METNELKVLALYLGDYNRQLYLREIGRLAKLPLRTTQTTLAKLEKDKLLRSKVHGKNKYFALNLDNIHTKLRIMQAELYKTEQFLDKYPEFKLFTKNISGNAPIIIFGSFAKFSADKNSDVDLLVISGKKQKLPLHLMPHKVHQIGLSESSFVKAIKAREPIIKEIKEHHIILNNQSYYVNAMWGENER